MANDLQNLTNPNDMVDIRLLNYFEGKMGNKYASQAGLDEVMSVIGMDTDYEYVDLGLPSGTLWARCNIGAAEEFIYGNYYKYGAGSTVYQSENPNYTGQEDPLASQYDTATQVMGSMWNIPTKAQFEELLANTTFTWETNFRGSNRNGGKFTAANSNYIFIPCGGKSGSSGEIGQYANIWLSTPGTSADMAYQVSLRSYNQSAAAVSSYRGSGFNVRGVISGNILGQLKGKADKATTYTKAEIDAMVPYYDAEHRCIVCP